MQKKLSCLIAIIAVTTLLLFPATPSYAANATFVANQIVVKLNPVTGATIEAVNATYGTSVIKPLPNTPGIYLLSTPTGVDPATLAAGMATDVRLLFAEPNFISQILEGIGRGNWAWGGPDANPLTQQYALNLLGVPQAHTLSKGAGSIVAVLDTGVQLDHPALAGKLIPGYDFIDNDNIPAEAFAQLALQGADQIAGHGTHVAGIVRQTAPDAQIMPVRVLDAHGLSDAFIVAQGIQYAAQHGAHVINLSLGTADKSELIQDVLHTIVEGGNVVVVGAAGNANSDAKQWPAASSYVIGVTAIGANRQKAAFANYGSWVDMAAPGDGIYSAFPLNGYAWWSGTSMAAPFIAGQAALIHSRFPTLNSQQVTDRIEKTAQRLGGKLGEGLPNLVASLQ